MEGVVWVKNFITMAFPQKGYRISSLLPQFSCSPSLEKKEDKKPPVYVKFSVEWLF
jgi:hypothetical protein